MSIFLRKKTIALKVAREIMSELKEEKAPLPDAYCVSDVATFLEAFGTLKNCRLNKMTSHQKELAKLYIAEALNLLEELESNLHLPQTVYAHYLVGYWVKHIGLSKLCFREKLPMWKRIITIYRHW